MLDYAFHPQGYALTAVLDSAPQNAAAFVLNPDGTFRYTPQTDFVGQDTFAYHVTNGLLSSATVELTFNVTAGPVAHDETYILAADGSLSASAANGVLANVFNLGQGSLSAQLVQGPTSGTLSLQPDGSFSYIPDPAQPPQTALTFTYAVVGGAAPLVAGGAAPVIQAVVTLLPAAAAPTYTVESVKFTDALHLLKDEDGTRRVAEWKATDTVRLPVAYVSGASGHVKVEFTVTGGGFKAGDKFLVVGVASIDGFPPIVGKGTLIGNQVVVDGAAFNLPKSPAVLDNLDIQWYVLPPNSPLTGLLAGLANPAAKDLIAALVLLNPGLAANPLGGLANGALLAQALGDWSQAAGTTPLRMYVTYKAPPKEAALFQTTVRLGTQAAEEAACLAGARPTDDQVMAAVFARFTLLDIHKVDETKADVDQGKLLTYWRNWDLPDAVIGKASDALATLDLLTKTDGNCVSWTHFFSEVLRSQGLTEFTQIGILPPLGPKGEEGRMFFKGWIVDPNVPKDDLLKSFPKDPQLTWPSNDVLPQKIGGVWQMDPKSNGMLYSKLTSETLHGQGFDPAGNQPPVGYFPNHALVRLRYKGYFIFFDPSYGVLYEPQSLKDGKPPDEDVDKADLKKQFADPKNMPYIGFFVKDPVGGRLHYILHVNPGTGTNFRVEYFKK